MLFALLVFRVFLNSITTVLLLREVFNGMLGETIGFVLPCSVVLLAGAGLQLYWAKNNASIGVVRQTQRKTPIAQRACSLRTKRGPCEIVAAKDSIVATPVVEEDTLVSV